jgi:hypothetical protein
MLLPPQLTFAWPGPVLLLAAHYVAADQPARGRIGFVGIGRYDKRHHHGETGMVWTGNADEFDFIFLKEV